MSVEAYIRLGLSETNGSFREGLQGADRGPAAIPERAAPIII